MKELISSLLQLNKDYNITGIKQSFEDEGASQQDVLTMRRITEQAGVDLSVKIGGCEAKTDISFCKSIGVNKIVAPMIESKFALSKFIESVVDINNIEFYINIESHYAQKNIKAILDSPSSKLLSGIVVGRSDMIKSYGFTKENTDGYMMNEIVGKVFKEAKQYNLNTIMGGNISLKSSNIIQRLYIRLEMQTTINIYVTINKNFST